jgi:hypothetical protein
MSEPSKATNLTPPIRSIAAEASSIIQADGTTATKRKANLKPAKGRIRERSPSSSSSNSMSSSLSSSTRHSVNQHTDDDDDDYSSNEDPNPELAQLELRFQTLRRLSKEKHSQMILFN